MVVVVVRWSPRTLLCKSSMWASGINTGKIFTVERLIGSLLLSLRLSRTMTTWTRLRGAILETTSPSAHTALIPTASSTNGSFQEFVEQNISVARDVHSCCWGSTERLRSCFSCIEAVMSFDGVKWTKRVRCGAYFFYCTSSNSLIALCCHSFTFPIVFVVFIVPTALHCFSLI